MRTTAINATANTATQPPTMPSRSTRARRDVASAACASHAASHTPPQSTPPSLALRTPSEHDDMAPGRNTHGPRDTSRM
jgi:hypothetical protein